MNCWCKEVETYNCRNCIKVYFWKKIPEPDKLDLLVYEKQIRLNRVDNKLLLKLLNKNLCISMIPERKTL